MSYYIRRNKDKGKVKGPYDLKDLKDLVKLGEFNEADLLSKDKVKWYIAGKTDGLFLEKNNQIYDDPYSAPKSIENESTAYQRKKLDKFNFKSSNNKKVQSKKISKPSKRVKPEFASRSLRFRGALLDYFILILIFLVICITFFPNELKTWIQVESKSNRQVEYDYIENLIANGISLGLFFCLNGYLLFTKGQTIAKHLLGMKIVTNRYEEVRTGNILIRYLPQWFLAFIPLPLVVAAIGILNCLSIFFTKEKQCLHDVIAKTYVIRTEE